jgi:hypothetical protein
MISYGRLDHLQALLLQALLLQTMENDATCTHSSPRAYEIKPIHTKSPERVGSEGQSVV